MEAAWFALVVVCLVMYVMLDGYDLGIGIGVLFDRDRRRRRESVEVVAQAWDVNESWLILLGVILWAGFPWIFGAALPHLYIPLAIMLLALAVRGFSTELLSHRPASGEGWVWAFGIGSLIVALAQGAALGSLAGDVVRDQAGDFAGTAGDFVSWYALIGAVGAVGLYGVLGMTYLRGKLDGDGSRLGRGFLIVAVGAAVIAILALQQSSAPLRFGGLQGVVVIVLLVLAAALAALTWWSLHPGGRGPGAYRWAAGLALSVLVAVVVGRLPVVLAPDLTVHDAASPGITLIFLLIAVGVNIPLVFFYNWFAHRTFRGRLDAPEPEEVS